jgi:hypothetical protein
MITDITSEQYRMLHYIENLHQNGIRKEQREIIQLKKEKKIKLEAMKRIKITSVSKKDNKIFTHDFYWN